MKVSKFILSMAVFAVVASCTKEKPVVVYLDVTPNSISGSWELVLLNDSELQEGTYLYVDFVRKERTFAIYQNFDSIDQQPHVLTGTFSIETDVERGAIIRGIYDYDGGFWAHQYEVNDLTENSMEWVAVDDPSYVQKFVRTSIPESIKGTDK